MALDYCLGPQHTYSSPRVYVWICSVQKDARGSHTVTQMVEFYGTHAYQSRYTSHAGDGSSLACCSFISLSFFSASRSSGIKTNVQSTQKRQIAAPTLQRRTSAQQQSANSICQRQAECKLQIDICDNCNTFAFLQRTTRQLQRHILQSQVVQANLRAYCHHGRTKV